MPSTNADNKGRSHHRQVQKCHRAYIADRNLHNRASYDSYRRYFGLPDRRKL